MSKENTIVAKQMSDGTLVQILPDGTTRPLPDRTDWARVDAMTDEQVHAAAMADPDARELQRRFVDSAGGADLSNAQSAIMFSMAPLTSLSAISTQVDPDSVASFRRECPRSVSASTTPAETMPTQISSARSMAKMKTMPFVLPTGPRTSIAMIAAV